jgi:membrane-bound lytic murein transglycosylase F
LNATAAEQRRGRTSIVLRAAVSAAVVAAVGLPVAISQLPRTSALERIHARGVLRIAALNSPAGCYHDGDGYAGYECDLLRNFAQGLDVPMSVELYPSAPEVIDAVRTGRADIGAGGLTIEPVWRRWIRFSPPLRVTHEQLVYTMGVVPPPSLAKLKGRLAVASDSSAAALLETEARRYPTLQWTTSDDDAADLLGQVASGDLDFTIAPSDLVAAVARDRPQLRVAFNVTGPRMLAWALPLHDSGGLARAVREFLEGRGQLLMDSLREQYFGRHVNRLDFADVSQFLSDVHDRLPLYRDVFEQAASQNRLDWRLLAAIGYQESHWNEAAESDTGVRGLMMLTVATAADVNVSDRGDPTQSIYGAARYFSALKDALPDSIGEPDRTWMALAAYNMGLGHLADARQLTKLNGGDPDDWSDVRASVRLLMQQRWYQKVAHGYARGGQALNFVGNVQAYYDLLDDTLRNRVPAPHGAETAQLD